MNKYIIFVLLLCSCLSSSPQTIKHPLNWGNNINYGLNKAALSNKLVLLYFYDNYCEWCDLLDTSIVENGEILNNFVLIKVNVEKSELAKMVGIKIVPTVIVILPSENSGEPIGSFVGYMDKDKFKEFIELNSKKASYLKVLL